MAETEDLKSFQCRFESDRGHYNSKKQLHNLFCPRGSVVEQLIRNEQIVGSIPTEGSIHFFVGTTGFEPMAFRPPA